MTRDGCIRRLTSNFHLQIPTLEWAWFSLFECRVILLETMPNLRANFEVKTSRGGRPHDLYWCETFEKLLHTSLTRRLHFQLYDRWYIANNFSFFIYLPFTNVAFYIRSVLCNFLTVLSALNLLINATYFNPRNKTVL